MKRHLFALAIAILVPLSVQAQTTLAGETATVGSKRVWVADAPVLELGVTSTGTLVPRLLATDGSPASATATTVKSTALESSHILKSSAGKLVSLHVLNTKASAQYILILDSATLTADGAVTLLYPPIYLAATSNASLNFTIPLTAANGIVVCNSSTGTFTKTIGSADCIFVAQVQ